MRVINARPIFIYMIYIMLGTNLAPSQCWHWTQFFAQCWHRDVSVPKSSPCQYGAPSAETGRKKISQFQHWAPSAGTGTPVPELGQSLVIATWHPPHIGTGARSGMALRHTLQFMANHYIICPIESQSYAPIGIEFSSLLGQYFDKRA